VEGVWFSFTAPVTDDDVGVHIRNADAQGIWWVDSMRLFEEKLGSPAGHNLLDNPDFEEGAEPGNRWTFFVTPAGGAKASCMIDTRNPASGKASLKVVVENPHRGVACAPLPVRASHRARQDLRVQGEAALGSTEEARDPGRPPGAALDCLWRPVTPCCGASQAVAGRGLSPPYLRHDITVAS